MKKNRLYLILLFMLFALVGCDDGELAGRLDAETIVAEMEDVSPSDWFYRYVVAGLRFGLITAESGENFRFEPDRDVTQGEFITMLGRLHEYGHGTIGTPNDGPFYERYIEWALERGIVHSYKYWDLMPCAPITREQKVVILNRYLNLFDLWGYVRFDGGTFTALFHDHYEISPWARGSAESFRTDFMIFSRDGYFNPHYTVTRAEALGMFVEISNAIYAKSLDVEASTLEMEDVSPDDWFYRYVVDGLRFGLITNESDEGFRFEPDRYVNLGEFITMLGRLHEYGHGAIGTPGDGPFYERYLAWAVERGIIYSNEYWDVMPCTLITREIKAVIVYKYINAYNLLDYLLHDYVVIAALFGDYNEMSYWARMPIERLRIRLIVFSRYRDYFKPHDFVAHAEALQILIRVCSAVYDLVHPLPRQ